MDLRTADYRRKDGNFYGLGTHDARVTRGRVGVDAVLVEPGLCEGLECVGAGRRNEGHYFSERRPTCQKELRLKDKRTSSILQI